MKSTVGRGFDTATATVATLGLTASPAQAAFDTAYCRVHFTSCRSGDITSHSSQHWIRYWMGSGSLCGADWRIVDGDNGAVVASGSVPQNATAAGTIYGLHGRYHMTIVNGCTGADGWLRNYT
ncbi:hypothetical protein Lfu02_03420 [Longispora fulva]|uniref:Uncharacterized protein n=1 Tax=Longispora fulva TaxID=619741 RepID=A0A8J7GC24_9ACTN|nr:hypothetical protein [Longispora fulva]MBG6135789.1 hypothetical protein [Longispora fulva]GIG55970.1 hypothetical protein Lfu02_03420 [Longispora fulva]